MSKVYKINKKCVKAALKLTEAELTILGEYVKRNLPDWIKENNFLSKNYRDSGLIERIVRVEESLKSQIELSRKGFEMMDKRFKDQQLYMEKRFEQVDKRLEQMNHRFTQTNVLIIAVVTIVTAFIGFLKFY